MQKLLSKSKFAKLAGVNPSTMTRISKTLLAAAVVGKHIDAAHPDAVQYLADKERAKTPEPATGIDPLYEEAVAACNESGRYSASFIQRALRIGYNRATRIIQVMRVNGLVPEKGKELPAPPPAPSPLVASKPRGQAAVKEAKKRAPPPEEREGTIDIPEDIQSFADFTLRELIDKFGTDTRFVDWLSATQKIEAINEKRLKNAQTKGELISRDLVKNGVIDTFNSAHLRLMKDGAKSIAAGVISKHAAGAELSEVEAYVSDILGSFIKPVKGKITRVLKNANP
jgi:hypothetical protein